jgi:hypothetical protein
VLRTGDIGACRKDEGDYESAGEEEVTANHGFLRREVGD